MEDTSQDMGTGIAAGRKSVTVNIFCKIIHRMWPLVLQLE
jgi:hypothetical protein